MPLRVKLVSALAMMLLMIGVLIVGIFAAQTQTITMEGSVNFDISDKTLFVQDVRVQMDNNNKPYSLKEQGEFLPGYINGNFNMNLGSLDNTYGSFAIYFDIVNLIVDGQTAVYNAKATTTQEGVTLETSGEILGAELSADTATADELNNPANISGTIKLLVTATSVPTVYLNQITLTINEADEITDFQFVFTSDTTASLSAYNGMDEYVEVPSTFSIANNNFTNFELDNISAIGSDMYTNLSLAYGTWNYTDSNNNTGTLNYLSVMDGSVDLSSLALPLQVDVSYIVNIPIDNANSIVYFGSYLQMLTYIRDQYGVLNGGVYATFNGYERTLYTIEELNSFIITTFGDYNSDPSVLQNALPVTLALENPIIVPTYYEGSQYIVTSMVDGDGNGVFYDNDNIKQVILPNRLEHIGAYAFNSCDNLETISIPSTIKSIGRTAFSSCYSLVNIDLSNCKSLEIIQSYTFSNCLNLTSITIPEEVTTIQRSAFVSCYALAEVYNYSKHLEITLGNTSAAINGELGKYAKVVYNPEDIYEETKIQAIDNIQYYVDGEDFIALAPAVARILFTTVTLDVRTTEINEQAFYYCYNLTSITIPENVKSIGNSAFQSCYALAEVYNYSENFEISLDDTNSALNGGAGRYAKIVYNASDLVDGKLESRIQTINNVQYYVYGDDFIALAPAVARYSLITLTFDSKTTEIEQWAFSYCKNLISIDLSNCTILTKIEKDAFDSCESLTSIDLSECISLTCIEQSVFSFCHNLISVVFPDTDGWYGAEDESATTSIPMDMSNPTQNAIWLTAGYGEDFYDYYFKRNV